jgi:hypothetical protein
MQTLADRIREFFAEVKWRRLFAYVLMLAFIVFTSAGAGLIFLPAGLITAGATCGLVGYILGAD